MCTPSTALWITEEARLAILIPLCFGEIKTAVVTSPVLIVSAHRFGAIEFNRPMLLLSTLETGVPVWKWNSQL